ncbi:hypothetical protein ACMG4D_27045 (plasmid) [Escherichia coli]
MSLLELIRYLLQLMG